MPFNLQEECQALQQDASHYQVPNDHDVQSMDPASIADLLDGVQIAVSTCIDSLRIKGAIEATAQSSEAITDNEVFDVYRSLLKCVFQPPQ